MKLRANDLNNATSARGAQHARNAALVCLMVGVNVGQTTSSGSSEPRYTDMVDTPGTSAGAPMAIASVLAPHEAEPQPHPIAVFRRVSGLTWDQVARLFAVSRRSVHFWASGKAMSAEHEELLHRAVALVGGYEVGADQVRSALLSVVDGQQVLELLAARRFADVEGALRERLGPPSARTQVPRKRLSAAAMDARRPLPPDFLAAGEVDIPPAAPGRGRKVRTVRSQGHGTS